MGNATVICWIFIKKLTNYFNFLEIMNEKLENTIEELSNSKYRSIIIQLNEIPVLYTTGVKSPFKRRWVNIMALILLPVWILIYLNSVKNRLRLLKDLTGLENRIGEVNNIIVKEKLININK